jgi:hypothetical protein
MLERGEAYFEECRESESPILITGLALALGLSGREALGEYGRLEEYSYTVKALKSVCENFAEARIYGNNPAGAIFALKNYGWTDRTQQEISAPGGGPLQAEITVKMVRSGNGDNSSGN